MLYGVHGGPRGFGEGRTSLRNVTHTVGERPSSSNGRVVGRRIPYAFRASAVVVVVPAFNFVDARELLDLETRDLPGALDNP